MIIVVLWQIPRSLEATSKERFDMGDCAMRRCCVKNACDALRSWWSNVVLRIKKGVYVRCKFSYKNTSKTLNRFSWRVQGRTQGFVMTMNWDSFMIWFIWNYTIITFMLFSVLTTKEYFCTRINWWMNIWDGDAEWMMDEISQV